MGCARHLLSSGHNVESPGDTCGLAQATDLVDVGAESLTIGPLRYNGGSTETHALAHDSVAVDVVPWATCVDGGGAPLTDDQRGVERPQGETCDVGAFELEHCSSADDCDDLNDCTDNECTPEGLCSYPLAADGTSCDDAGIQGICFENDCVHP